MEKDLSLLHSVIFPTHIFNADMRFSHTCCLSSDYHSVALTSVIDNKHSPFSFRDWNDEVRMPAWESYGKALLPCVFTCPFPSAHREKGPMRLPVF